MRVVRVAVCDPPGRLLRWVAEAERQSGRPAPGPGRSARTGRGLAARTFQHFPQTSRQTPVSSVVLSFWSVLRPSRRGGMNPPSDQEVLRRPTQLAVLGAGPLRSAPLPLRPPFFAEWNCVSASRTQQHALPRRAHLRAFCAFFAALRAAFPPSSSPSPPPASAAAAPGLTAPAAPAAPAAASPPGPILACPQDPDRAAPPHQRLPAPPAQRAPPACILRPRRCQHWPGQRCARSNSARGSRSSCLLQHLPGTDPSVTTRSCAAPPSSPPPPPGPGRPRRRPPSGRALHRGPCRSTPPRPSSESARTGCRQGR